ncbi:Aminopeptidase 2 mitochondrial, partial [Kappamyces sp. JEL0680]
SGKITFPFVKSDTSFYKLNANVSGFYRVLYSNEQLKTLAKALEHNIASFSTQDRIGIISDAFALARSGLGSTVDALEVLKGYKGEESQMVLEELYNKFGALRTAWYQDKAALEGLNKLQSSIFAPKVRSLGYDYAPHEDQLTVLKRNVCIRAAVKASNQEVISELTARFRRYVAGDKEAFHANLRQAVFEAVLKHSQSPSADFDAIMNIYHGATAADEKIAALESLGASNDLELARRLLHDITMNPDIVKLQDSMYPVLSLSTLNPHREQVLAMLWSWITENWPTIFNKLSTTISLLGRVFEHSINMNIGEEFALKVEAWAKGEDCSSAEAKAERLKQIKAIQRPMDQALETIRGNTQWRNRESRVSAWLAANADSF